MGNYGVPYKGSKNKIAERLFKFIPTATNFYDLFCGGCAMSHRAFMEKRFRHVYANDLDGAGLRLFIDAVNGRYHDEKRWISREDFFRLKDTDPFVALCWSFGNNMRDYLYAKEIEPYKRAAHYAVVLNDFGPLRKLEPEFAQVAERELGGDKDTRTRRFFFARLWDDWRGSHKISGGGNVEFRKQAPWHGPLRVQSLERLKLLRRIEYLERKDRLVGVEDCIFTEATFKDYREVEIHADSVVYCDIPYCGTNGYGREKRGTWTDATYEEFYAWCRRQTELTLISEYAMPDDFVCVAELSHLSTLSGTSNHHVTERLFVPKHQLGMYERMMNRGTLFG